MITLEDLLEYIQEALPEDAAPVWLRVDRARDHLAVAIRAEEDGMLGWNAPPECCAIGMVGGGWARRYAPPGRHRTLGRRHAAPAPPAAGPPAAGPPAAGPPVAGPPGRAATPLAPMGPGRVKIALLIDREGRVVSRTTLADGTILEEPPACGRVIDILRRCLGLPTEAPEIGPEALLAAVWMARILETGVGDASPLDWEQVARLHPAMTALATSGEEVGAEHLETAIRAASRAWSWENLRSQAAEGACPYQSVSPELARWMDEGMFSRWVLESCPSVDSLLGQASTGRLSASAGRRLRHVLKRTGLYAPVSARATAQP